MTRLPFHGYLQRQTTGLIWSAYSVNVAEEWGVGACAGVCRKNSLRSTRGSKTGAHLSQEVIDTLRTEAIAVLGYSGIPQAVPILERLLLDPQVSRRAADAVRRQAATALSAHGSDAAGQVLMDAVRNSNRAVRDATKDALQRRR